jgi:hypothetical protein
LAVPFGVLRNPAHRSGDDASGCPQADSRIKKMGNTYTSDTRIENPFHTRKPVHEKRSSFLLTRDAVFREPKWRVLIQLVEAQFRVDFEDRTLPIGGNITVNFGDAG